MDLELVDAEVEFVVVKGTRLFWLGQLLFLSLVCSNQMLRHPLLKQYITSLKKWKSIFALTQRSVDVDQNDRSQIEVLLILSFFTNNRV